MGISVHPRRHFRLNAKARKNSLPLYVLIRLLHREATTVTWQMRLLSEGKVLRCRRARQQTVAHKHKKNYTDIFNIIIMSPDPCSTSFNADHMLSLAAA